MNQNDLALFDELTKDREENARFLAKKSMKGVKPITIDKYTDQAHFIYELLQNADDAHATSACFRLSSERLIFVHNGTRHFTLSSVQTEDGDINAITSVGNSSKKSNTIGKFGVGFKAVFQYTDTPHIYNPTFNFKIEDFIVPRLLQEDFPGRAKDETLFVFPFDNPEKPAAEAYQDIREKLMSLTAPLLFLTHLQTISYQLEDGTSGQYDKTTLKHRTFDTTTAELLALNHSHGTSQQDRLWLFSRQDDSDRRYAVGFFLDKNGQLCPTDEPAFCFFPTKEVTGLNFILHAPFLLTKSREGIMAGNQHNEQMVALLANLAADSLEYLRDLSRDTPSPLINDTILNIIPVDASKFSSPSNKSRISFYPIFDAIRNKMMTAELLPSTDGYVTAQDAYWADVPQLTQLFSNEQLADITDNANAHWVFTSLGRSSLQNSNHILFDYIDQHLVRTFITDEIIVRGRNADYAMARGIKTSESIRGITPSFIEAQQITWLHTFYKWMSETARRLKIAETIPIFLNQQRKATSAKNEKGHYILFLHDESNLGYDCVLPELLTNRDTASFITALGIKEPALKDQIYNFILRQYNDNQCIGDPDQHFQIFFRYFCECQNSGNELDKFIVDIKDKMFLRYYTEEGENGFSEGNRLYISSTPLKRYFSGKISTRYIDIQKYHQLISDKPKDTLDMFLRRLDVSTFIRQHEVVDYFPRTDNKCSLDHPIDGLLELIQKVSESKDNKLSLFLWNQLCVFSRTPNHGKSIYSEIENMNMLELSSVKIYIKRQNSYCRFKEQLRVPTQTLISLRQQPWLVNDQGEFVSAEHVTKNHLHAQYDQNEASGLMELLGLKDCLPSEIPAQVDSHLTQEQRDKIAWADQILELGIKSQDDINDFLEYRKRREARKENRRERTDSSVSPEEDDSERLDLMALLDDTGSHSGDSSTDERPPAAARQSRSSHRATARVLKDIVQQVQTLRQQPTPHTETAPDHDDEDEYLPVPVDFSKRIQRSSTSLAHEIDHLTQLETLQEEAFRLTRDSKYSLAWFRKLLEMECIHSSEAQAYSQEIFISFAQAVREPGTKRVIILSQPSRGIPQFLEELTGVDLVLHMGEQQKQIPIDVACVQSYTLKVKVKRDVDIESLDFSSVTAAIINATSPAFLLEELKNRFAELTYPETYNLKEHLCPNLEFVFGPPGTGKTTYLVSNTIIPAMRQSGPCHMLVLTPTNKSADVLTRKIMEQCPEDIPCTDWLVRFGTTSDELIEQSPVFRDKTLDIRNLKRSVTVTTIARFAYDFFMPEKQRLYLRDLNWDLMVIDEASMIPLHTIILPLYLKTPSKFIIAGDPFQIEPITTIDLWRNENIYTLTELQSFTHPTTKPHNYPVTTLTTQYRSIPDIGVIYSKLAYGGILKHAREADSQLPISLGNGTQLDTLNIIRFPVKKYESVYRAKRLHQSSCYHIYSALLVFEYVCHLVRTIDKHNPDICLRIGIIAPYRAQADMMDRLMSSVRLPERLKVLVGTIHSFQGDECDIIFAVLNTPPNLSDSQRIFLNKLNILNVSLSRARDYLFLVMPDEDTEGMDCLALLRKIEHLLKATGACREVSSASLEEEIFQDAHFLENNVFSTSHQMVNVYGLPDKRYEIRSEDNAVDIQLHG